MAEAGRMLAELPPLRPVRALPDTGLREYRSARMNTPSLRPLRAFRLALTLVACVAPALAGATEAHLSAGASASAVVPSAATERQLQRLSQEAALLDSSVFGQLRLLRDVEATRVCCVGKRSGESCQ